MTLTSKAARHCSGWIRQPGRGRPPGVVNQNVEFVENICSRFDPVEMGQIHRPGGGAEALGQEVQPR